MSKKIYKEIEEEVKLLPISKKYPSKVKVKKADKAITEDLEGSVVLDKSKNIEDESLIKTELKLLEGEIEEIFKVLNSIDPMTIDDIEERLKALKLKMDIQLKLPTMLNSLDNLRNKERIKAESIIGGRDMSPLEDGLLD